MKLEEQSTRDTTLEGQYTWGITQEEWSTHKGYNTGGAVHIG